MWRLKVVLVISEVLFLATPSLAMDSSDLCNKKPHCYHNQSLLCEIQEKPLSCNHMLRHESEGNCEVMRIDPNECFIESANLTPPDKLPFILRMYFYNTWMLTRAAMNLSFVAPNWQTLKFRYKRRDNTESLCRNFSLSNVSLPLVDTLMWDCIFFNRFGYSNHTYDLSIITDQGTGGNFGFREPKKENFDHHNTKLEDWHVFFFLHLDHIQRSAYLPVTIQSAPFKNISYNVSLVKCMDADLQCLHRSTLVSRVVGEPETANWTDNIPPLWNELLPSWGAPAHYAVTVQIVSSLCPSTGCYISLSPVFEVKESQLGMWIFISCMFILIFAFAFTFTLHHRTKENKKLLETLRQNLPSVLLIYLPENSACLELVKTLAGFLKDTCYAQPYIVDTDVGTENPNNWTSEQMNKASKILFIVPGNLNGESATPIRGQWTFALRYLTGHYFITHHVTKKVATVLLPFSADVPCQIASIRRFDLLQEMASLVTWIHDGTWLDHKLFWGPQIRASHRASSSSCSLADVNSAVRKAAQCTKCYRKPALPALVDFTEKKSSNDAVTVKMPEEEKNVLLNYKLSTPSEEKFVTKDVPDRSLVRGDKSGCTFDQDIPDVDTVLGYEEMPKMSEKTYNFLDSDLDELDDDIFLGRVK
ncbi:uncharacterized protein LOC119586945 [Penaeus monodon]|uniref:uncharacterized protein LOC119586945 n=1 Tax=Penaeus monodon TaxID=6687 RepID=UPI0018A73A10|nr:uncharacterized protein LOC119586945 [Penaeus monodon]